MDKAHMKVLVISAEAWRDDTNGGNVLSNIFYNMDATFAQIYCSTQLPSNKICKKYFRQTDIMMVKNFFSKNEIGEELKVEKKPKQDNIKKLNFKKDNKVNSFFKKYNFQIFYLIKELAWLFYGVKNKKLELFVNDFQPDIIFAPCYGSPYMLRLTRYIAKLTNKKIISYISDDHYTLKQWNWSPVFWLNRLWLRGSVKKTFPHYSLTYTMTQEQKNEYEAALNCKMKILQKGGSLESVAPELLQHVGKPIKLVYAGSIYAGRLKTLKSLSAALRIINKNGCKFKLAIYTGSHLSEKDVKKLNDGVTCKLHGLVSLNVLDEIYKRSDIALHIESFEMRYKLLTRLSFSTKIVDCLFSSCAVMAICWSQHSGYIYLKDNDAAFCINDIDNIVPFLEELYANPTKIIDYKQRAYELCRANHDLSVIRKKLQNDFKNIV